MELVVAGVSHKSAPLTVRERLAVLSPDDVYERLRRGGLREAVVLSTCNRFELYACAPAEASSAALEELAGGPISEHSYLRQGPEAVRHLFEVAAGLDSLVVGETEILGQVKTAYERALAAGMTGKLSNVLFQRALFAGKKARSDTAIAVGQTSVASVAVQLAESIFGDLRSSEVLVLGAGQMAELTARHLLSRKVSRLCIANRTWDRAFKLAKSLKAQPLRWEEFPAALPAVDIVVSSTGSERPILTRETVAAAARDRAGRSLFLIDIAMPRDIEETVHGLEHVYLYRLEDLEGIVANNLSSRGGEIARARDIVARLSAEFSSWAQSLGTGQERSLKHSRLGEALP